MHNENDIRWHQRLTNYGRSLGKLENAVELSTQRPLSELEKYGLVQGFEMVFELAWNLMKDFFTWQGNAGIAGSRDAIREAFKQGLVSDGEGWMDMIRSRNQAAHVYNEAVANAIAERITQHYVLLFRAFGHEMIRRRDSA